MQRLRILVILILLSLMPLYSLAVLNEGQYAFRSLDINNGLSQNTVHAILQDKQGFMWFGTKDGLDRYDGISFRTFMKESGTLGNNFITSLYEDNLGQIWIGTDVGLYVYCPQMEKVRHFTLISNSNIYRLYGQSDNWGPERRYLGCNSDAGNLLLQSPG